MYNNKKKRFMLYMKVYFSLYKKMYNDTNIFLIHESVFPIIQDDVYDNKYFCYT